jgi:hypothetical protein
MTTKDRTKSFDSEINDYLILAQFVIFFLNLMNIIIRFRRLLKCCVGTLHKLRGE